MGGGSSLSLPRELNPPATATPSPHPYGPHPATASACVPPIATPTDRICALWICALAMLAFGLISERSTSSVKPLHAAGRLPGLEKTAAITTEPPGTVRLAALVPVAAAAGVSRPLPVML